VTKVVPRRLSPALRRGYRRAARALALGVLAGLGSAACSVLSQPAAAPTHAAAKTSPPGGRSPGSPSPSASARTSEPASHGKPLAGKLVGIDPGHNGRNSSDPAFIDHQIFNGRTMESCNTVGTETAGGYTEARFNFNVATYLAADLRAAGATVVLTRRNNHGVGPCVNKRSTMLNHTDVAIDIHADGGPATGRGFTVLEPVADGPNDKVIASSVRFGRYVHHAFLADTPFRTSDYYGHDGYRFRDDLAGLNLTTVPKVLIECGNMPNPADAALLTSPRVQREIARALEAAIVRFLTGRWPSGRQAAQ
jgi:N-acetylmuramoyl-L-alanine amidase